MTSKRVTAYLTAVMVVLTGVFTFAAAPAQAAAAPNQPFMLKHIQTGDCLDGSVSQGARLNVCTTPRGDNPYQTFVFNDSGLWSQIFGQGDYCVDGSISSGIRMNACSSDFNPYQTWGYNSRTREIRHYQTAYCLDGAASTGLRLRPCAEDDDNPYQRWSLFKINS